MPWIGETSSPGGSAAAAGLALAPRRLARAAAPLPPLPPASPITFTSNRRPDTSTAYSRETFSATSPSSPGFSGAGKASCFSHSLSSTRSRQVSPRAHCSVSSSARWKGIRVLSPPISYSSSARSIRRVDASRSTSHTISLAIIGS